MAREFGHTPIRSESKTWRGRWRYLLRCKRGGGGLVVASLLGFSLPASVASAAVIAWNAPPNDPDHYVLETSIQGTPFEQIARIDGNVTQAEVPLEVPQVMRVGACNSDDVCVYSEETVLSPKAPPGPAIAPPGKPGAPRLLP